MAINVNTVYRTVLSILNKEQRGYMTPDEFNKTATQVQLDIFEKYFDDLNQQLRVPQTDTDYADRQMNIDEKIAIFKTFGQCIYQNPGGYFTLPTVDFYGNTVEFYRLGTVVFNDEVELQRLDRHDFYNVERSKLTRASLQFPNYLYENELLFVRPTVITSNVTANYVRKPLDVRWGYSIGPQGQYLYDSTVYDAVANPTGSTQFELHPSEQSEVVIKILMYAGIIIRDPQIVQAAAQEAAMNEQNEKI
tara:strand:+ start:1079 stop:1825 length:747 start_codon:yes stop_codon:yes gene_type:complete